MRERSGCPINLSMEVLGDRWTLVILRDMMFGNRRSFRDLLTNSVEGIASNILAARLRMLLAEGIITRTPDPAHKQKSTYSLTEKAIALVPVMVHLGAWGTAYLPVTPELAIRARVLADGGPALWDDFMDELRHLHLEARRAPEAGSVLDRLQRAYEAVAGSAGTGRHTP